MDIDRQLLVQALTALGDVLAGRMERHELVVVGGSALLIAGYGVRPTRDLDVLAVVDGDRYVSADPLPESLQEAARDVALTYGLNLDWLNPGPTSLLDLGLPDGFERRVVTEHYESLVIHVAGRLDQIFFKLYAGVDQGIESKHVADLIRLDPREDELLEAAAWATTHDPSPGFRIELIGVLEHLGVEDAHSRLD